MLPESGEVRVAGRSTRDIPSDTDWLASLDRFGLVTARAVLLDQLTARANLALPLTLSIDPIPAPVRTEVDLLGEDVGLGADRLDARASDLTPGERVRLHLARALALRPRILLLEHPTVDVTEAAEAEALGAMVGRLAAARGFGWVALTDDQRFARSSRARLLRLDAATGRLSPLAGSGRGLLARLFGRP